MADADKLRRQLDIGNRAKEIFEDGLVKEFFEKMRAECRQAWETSKIEDQDVRQDAYLMLKLVERLESCFRLTVANGEFARKELLRVDEEKKQ